MGSTRFEPIPGFADAALSVDAIISGATPDGSVLIYDDDHYYMGNVISAHLARTGHAVTLITPQPYIAGWMGYTLEQPRVAKQMQELGVEVIPNAVAVAWNCALQLQDANTGAALAPREGTLVPVGLRAPNLGLWNSLQGVSHKTLIGDAVAPGITQAAVFSGHKAARKFFNNGIEPEIKRERGLPV